MKKLFPIRFAVVLLVGLLFCCAHSQQTKQKEMKIKIEIVKGETTETSVLRLLGVPSSIATDNIGNEIWVYGNISFSVTNTPDDKRLILWELSTGTEGEKSDPFDLKIIFDQNDITKGYEIIRKTF